MSTSAIAGHHVNDGKGDWGRDHTWRTIASPPPQTSDLSERVLDGDSGDDLSWIQVF